MDMDALMNYSHNVYMYVVLVSAPAHVSFITKAYIYVLLSNFLHPKEQKKRK